MSLTNYTVPFAPPAATTFLGAHDFGGLSPAAAINSLLYDTPRQTPRQPLAPTSPNRRQTSKKVKDPRDPYRNQYPPQQSEYVLRNDRYHANQYEDNNYQEQNEESQINRHYLEEVNSQPTISSNNKNNIKRKQPQPPPPPTQPEERDDGSWPNRPPGYTRISNTFNSAPEPGAKTSIHAVLDFDDDFEDYNYEDDDIEPLPPSLQKSPKPQVTPIEGPILIKNGSVPVVPLYSYPTVNNGSLVQIPILWTALSLALGLEIRGEIIRGVPCIKRFHQLFCPTAGNSYPIDRIEKFIDDNKALMKRMYGEFQMSTEYGPPAREIYESKRRHVKRESGDESRKDGPDPLTDPDTKSDSYFAKHRQSRQSFSNNQNSQHSESGRVDACESKVEIVTPYWASNSAGKVRAIVNTQHFEQAIHQEVCSKVQTKRCVNDCGCEQKYKWHRLLAYDPDNDCKGIFMDWFLFPSCCVCRCAPTFGTNNN